MTGLRLLCAALALSLGGCALLRSESEKPAAKAEQATLVQAYELQIEAPTSNLRELLEEHLDLARFQRTPEAERPSSVELDRLRLLAPAQAKALLETAGYFDAQVEARLEARDSSKPLIRIQVTPGTPSRVRSIAWAFEGEVAGPQGAALREALQSNWPLEAEYRFTQTRWATAKSEALARARTQGYPLARWADTAARVLPAEHAVDISLSLDSGPLFRLGELRIEGLEFYPAEAVQRLAGFEPGQPYSEKALLDFQDRLLKTQLFDAVTIDIQREAEQSSATPVIVRVREAPRQQATTGIGYHANTGQRVLLEHLHRQPFGLPIRARTKLDLGRDLRAAELELSSYPQPDMQRNLMALRGAQDRSGDKIVDSFSIRLGRLRETVENERLVFVEALRSRESSATGRIDGGALSLNGNWTRRRLDSVLLPTEGHWAKLELGLGRADSSVAQNGIFGRALLKLGWYKPVGGWFASARTEVGQLLAADAVGIPETLLFRAGGDDSVRGYAYRSLGPLKSGLAVGGRSLWTGSVELARPVSAELSSVWGAVFVDAGQAAESFGQLKPDLGWGAGVRWRSPVGPLRLDVARGQATGRWRLHFSVGIAL
ncbi:BamA/TamA family outer membrane protein [Pelomonas sp. SE-A7]|uniref:autotransporter assembly complex protein TamA n=1 Tax=Pelomonas sp. SE-A7 TaxID=3054953 RepID=UPI00259CD513|nr:BamA/TamA family outer membrane protein [Pelomonas sp. SE-A7]MDM4767351.1 BamA/TamA family outer membrane protein [Pelomonas sp. SE-A7]